MSKKSSFNTREYVKSEKPGDEEDPDLKVDMAEVKLKYADRDMKQMIQVLHTRLAGIDKAAKYRMELLKEDTEANSKKNYSQAPKISEESEIQYMTRISRADMKNASANPKESNLVSAEGIIIDPVRLLMRSKQQTETAKKLETRIEDMFSSSSLRDTKGKKGKKSNRTEQTKKKEAKQFEAKKLTRLRLEKELSANIENYITRSVLEPELVYRCPDPAASTSDPLLDLFKEVAPREEPLFPITIRWPAKHPRAKDFDNADGEMDPDVILQYSLERISLPSGEVTFRWLLKHAVAQDLFVHLFWFIKVKFFQKDNNGREERHLLIKVSSYYVDLVSLLSKHCHTQHEKDFFFKFFPYIMCNGIFYSLFYLCPGSRHLYTKGFRKTVLMQIVQILFGVQLCPISVKVTWAKLFPDDAHDDIEEGGEDNAQLPMSIALSTGVLPVIEANVKATSEAMGMGSPDISPPASAASPTRASGGPAAKPGVLAGAGAGQEGQDAGASFESAPGGLQRQSVGSDGHSLAGAGAGTGRSPSRSRPGTGGSHGAGAGTGAGTGMDKKATGGFDTGGHLNPFVEPLERVEMKAAQDRPENSNFLSLRQKRDTLDAFHMSPIMQQYLSAPSASNRRKQTMHRTTPINWCAAGGTDTYRRIIVPRELHDDLSVQAKTTAQIARKDGLLLQKQTMKDLKKIEKTCSSVLTTSAQVSRYSIEIIKRQKELIRREKKGRKAAHGAELIAPISYLPTAEELAAADLHKEKSDIDANG
jgi:hypothetical protein